MFVIDVVNRVTIPKIVGSKMCVLTAKWPKGDKLLQIPKEGKVKLEVDKL